MDPYIRPRRDGLLPLGRHGGDGDPGTAAGGAGERRKGHPGNPWGFKEEILTSSHSGATKPGVSCMRDGTALEVTAQEREILTASVEAAKKIGEHIKHLDGPITAVQIPGSL